MAVAYVNITPTNTVAFTRRCAGNGYQDIVLTFTNQSGPTASVVVSFSDVSAPFSYVSGAGGFTLAANGDSNTITIRFTPTVAGTFSDSITVNCSGGFTPQPTGTITLSASAWSPIYTLPQINNMACGVIKATLIMPLTADELTVPTKNTFLDITSITETGQEQLSQASAGTAKITVVDDYTTHTEGFWWKASQYALSLRFYLVEGGADTFLFYGSIQPQQTTWTEHYVGTLGYVREGEFILLSAEGVLFSTATSAWVTEALARSTILSWPSAPGNRGVIALIDLFECMLTTAALNVWVTTGGYDIDVILDTSTPDLVYYNTGTAYDFSSIHIGTSSYNSSGSSTYYINDYWDNANTHGHALAIKHATLQDAISSILFNFGLTMRMSYDVATERHKIQLIQLGRAHATLTTQDNNPIDSSIVFSTNLIGDAVRVQQEDAAAYAWVSKKYNSAGLSDANPPPGYISFDIDKPILFNLVVPDYTSEYTSSRSLFLNATPIAIDDIKVWRYDTGAYYDRGALDAYSMLDAMAKYYYYRLPQVNKLQVNRTYPTLTLGGSHLNSVVMQRIAIDLGSGSSNYYANKITKNVLTNNLLVEWIQE